MTCAQKLLSSNVVIEQAKSIDGRMIETLLRMSFAFSVARSEEYLAHVGTEAFFVVRDGSRLAACAALLETRQRFGGNWIPSANIAHVAIAPEARGTGLAIPLVDALSRTAASRGAAMVTLYASARPVYRKCGFELAGSEMIYEAETSALPSRTDLTFRRIELDDPLLARAYDAKTLNEAGLLDRTERHWREIRRAPCHALEAYGAGHGRLSAYAIVDASDPSCLTIRDWHAATGEDAAGLLAFLGRFRSVYSIVRWHGGPHDDLVAAMPDKGWRLAHQEDWMTRILDPRAALAQRGYQMSDGRLGLSIVHPDGRRSDLVLEISAGVPQVSEGEVKNAPTLTLSAPTFASLFTGFRSASRLRRRGLIETGADGARLADLVFGGPAPWLAEHV